MAHRQRIFVTTTDLAATEAVLPVLREMQRGEAYEAVVFAAPDSAAAFAYGRASVPTKHAGHYLHATLTLETMRVILAEENPDVVLAGISNDDRSTDRLALEAARAENIPCCAIVETYPGVWLTRYGPRDGESYRRADALFVPDEISARVAIAHGFDRDRVRVTGNPADDVLVAHACELDHRRAFMRREFGIAASAVVISWFGTYDLDNPKHRGPTFEGRYGFGEAEAYREYLEAIRDGAAIAERDGRVLRGLFRQKPTYGHAGIRGIERELGIGVVHDLRKDGPITAIAGSDLVCSLIGGTTIHQAAKLGVPGAFYQPGATPETDDQATNALGITKSLYERGALRELILRIAADPDELTRLRDSLRPAAIVPGATGRVLEALGSLCS